MTGLVRFGGAALRLDRVDCICEVETDDVRPGVPPAVRVSFRGTRARTFAGPEAEALRTFVRSLADSTELSAPRSVAAPFVVPSPRNVQASGTE